MAKAKKTAKKTKKGIPVTGGEAAVKAHANGAKASSTERARIERRRYKEKLPCAIPPEEVVFKADEMARVFREAESLKEEKRNALADFRDRKAQIEENLSDLATAVELHTVSREVECIEYLIDGTGTLEVVRQDTLEVVICKAATSEDLQERIFEKIEKENAAEQAFKAAKAPDRTDSELLSALFDEEIAAKDAALGTSVTFDMEAGKRLRADADAQRS